MARSLEISCGPQILFDSNGTCGTPYEIVVTVDGQKNNASFTVSSILGDWYDYSVERCESPSFSPNSGYVKIIIKVPKNLLTINKIGLLKIEHNCAKIVKYVELKQTGVEYSLTATYDNGWQFKSMPDQLYEEKTVTISSNNGRGKWFVKEIQQYQVLSGDKFGDKTIEYVGKKEQDELMEQVRVPYDGVFNYRIDGNKLIVKSFGQIDLITKENKLGGALPHMRYFFVLEHSDVHNANKDELDNKGIEYRNRKLFIFDGDNGSGYEDGVTPSIDVPPIEGNSYKFMVNNSKSPIISVTKGGETKTITVISTKNGENLAYTAVLDGVSWCTINSDGTSLTVESNDGDYRECVIVYTQSETDDVIKLKVSQDAASEEFTFTVDGNSSNFTKETFGVSFAEYTPVVVSKKGNKDVEYTVYQQGTASWTKYSDGVITIEENNTTEERQSVYVFKQEGGSKKSPINVTIIQSAASESWVFTVSPTSKDANSSGETIPLTIISLHNGEFASFSVQEITDDWIYYDSLSKSIVVNPYSRDSEGSERSTTITFIQDRGNNVKVEQKVQIKQKKQESLSSILKFVDEGVEKDAMTLNYDGNGSTITVKIKSLDSNGLPDSNLQITDTPDWFSLTELTNSGYGYYITNVECKKNTSSAREEKITFTNSSGDSIVLTVKQEGEVIIENTITIKADTNIDDNNTVEMLIIEMVNGSVVPANKIGEFTFTKNTDSKQIKVNSKKLYFLYYNGGKGEGDLLIDEKIGSVKNVNFKREIGNYIIIENENEQVVTIDAQSVVLQYVYELLETKINVGWEGKTYNEPYGKVYSYSTDGTTKTAVPVTEVKIKDGDFISATNFEGPFTDSDDDSPYYKVSVTVETNGGNTPRTGHLTIINERGEELELEVEQIKNGDVILTEFDYIVMNYNWTDYVDSDNNVYSRDFDCVMFFNTESIGAMYKKYSAFSSKKISENETVYAELAYDQITSVLQKTDRIETQVVYLAKLKDDGYLNKIKNSGDRVLNIELYGNLYKAEYAEATPVWERQVDLTIHTYLGGTMIRDDANMTMQNVGGEEKSNITVSTYFLRSIHQVAGDTDSNVANFDHLGTLSYNVQDRTAVFSPNSDLFIPSSFS